MKKMLEEKLIKKLNERAKRVKDFKSVMAIDLKGEGGGRFVIDFGKHPLEVIEDATKAAESTIIMDGTAFEEMLSGKLNPQMAFLSGKVKVDGNLGLAIKLGQLLI